MRLVCPWIQVSDCSISISEFSASPTDPSTKVRVSSKFVMMAILTGDSTTKLGRWPRHYRRSNLTQTQETLSVALLELHINHLSLPGYLPLLAPCTYYSPHSVTVLTVRLITAINGKIQHLGYLWFLGYRTRPLISDSLSLTIRPIRRA